MMGPWAWMLCTQVALSSAGVLYPRESETREVRQLDGVWRFKPDNSSQMGFLHRWFAEPLKDTIPMPVPASYNDITQDKSLRDHVGTVWYERTFFVPDIWRRDRVWLRFSSVHYIAQVWINGKKVMFHEIGHLPFQRDVSSFLKFGTENRVTVAVDNILSDVTVPQGSLENFFTKDGEKVYQKYTFDFFNYAGIHRSVHLYTTPHIYIDDVTIYTDVDYKEEVTGMIYFNITYGGAITNNDVTLLVSVVDAEGATVSKASLDKSVGESFIGKLEVAGPKIWWPYLMNPEPGYLYKLEIHLISKRWSVEDVYRLPFGIRTIQWSNSSLMINHKPVYLRGVGRHEDSDIRGKGFDYALATKDYNLLKWLGVNAFRTSHYPYAEEIMDFADEMGFMVVDECPSVNTEKFSMQLLNKHKDSLTELIHRDKNRPSVIMWSVSNEPRSQYPEADDYFRSVVEHVKSLDPNRPVTADINQWRTVDKAAKHMDILSFNMYAGWYSYPGKLDTIQPLVEDAVSGWHSMHNKPVIIMEYGADTLTGFHEEPNFIWSEEYQIQLLSEHFEAFDSLRKRNLLVGEMVWNFADFRTDQSITRVGGNRKGLFTRARQPKSGAFHVRSRYLELAKELDSQELPSDLYKYTAPVAASVPLKDRNEL